jgi:hypothetical protein
MVCVTPQILTVLTTLFLLGSDPLFRSAGLSGSELHVSSSSSNLFASLPSPQSLAVLASKEGTWGAFFFFDFLLRWIVFRSDGLAIAELHVSFSSQDCASGAFPKPACAFD